MQPVRQILSNAPDVVAVPPELGVRQRFLHFWAIRVWFYGRNTSKYSKPLLALPIPILTVQRIDISFNEAVPKIRATFHLSIDILVNGTV